MPGYSQAAIPSMRVPVKNASSVLFNGLVITATPTINTLGVNPKGADRVGFFINLALEDSASSTIAVDIQFSPDKGTTWVDMPEGMNSQTKATLASITTTGSSYESWEINVEAQFTRLRANVVVGGSTASDTITLGPCYWIFSNVD